MALEIVKGIDTYFTFKIGGVCFGVNVGHISQLVEMVPIRRIPNAPKYLEGIINLSGEVLPVFDARMKLGFPEAEVTRSTCILVLVFELEGQVAGAGIIVDSVEKVVTPEPDQVKPAAALGQRYNPEFIEGIALMDDEPTILLRLETLFLEEEINFIQSV